MMIIQLGLGQLLARHPMQERYGSKHIRYEVISASNPWRLSSAMRRSER